MSVIKTYTAWEDVTVSISPSEVSESDLGEIAEACDRSFNQKMGKLGVITKTMKVYTNGKALLVNDAYNTCADFVEIAEALGFNVKEVNCSLKGKNYVLNDPIIDTLMVMDPKYTIKGKFLKATSEISSVITANSTVKQFDPEVKDIVSRLTKGKGVDVAGKREVVTTKDEWEGHWVKTLKVERGEVKSDEKVRVTGMAKAFFTDVQNSLDGVNSQLQNGTVSILNSRARKLGYTVQQQKVGNNVELVYERVG